MNAQEIIEKANNATLKKPEVSTPCWDDDGFGIIIEVHRKDELPIHAHVYDLDHNELGQILDTDEIPKTIEDLKECNGSNMDNETKEKIIEWANSTHRIVPIKCWHGISLSWEVTHD